MDPPPRPQSSLLTSPPELSPLEQEVLEEYERLAENMKNLATMLDNLASAPASDILDGLRELERKTSLAFTLLKASVYSIVLQQEIDWGGGGGAGGGGDGSEGVGGHGHGDEEEEDGEDEDEGYRGG
ncbi:DASH complex subunit Dad3-domain-containing protein [Dichotomopilus funicola]|uniref:DASH complex subunit DAD3 n=1 Tax=Dichotomopilus funicola TaxID=1934379 RepID=A0AAN6V209_9PEZI|nr:DASH complex subunit Dad3-domain-containing protein [Dichotomopilus funicola]